MLNIGQDSASSYRGHDSGGCSMTRCVLMKKLRTDFVTLQMIAQLVQALILRVIQADLSG